MTDRNGNGKRKTPAGGWGALAGFARVLFKSGAPFRTANGLRALNQPYGFDCTGCAWGDPEHVSPVEFCEKGAKALAWEATSKIVGPTFFAEHSVEWLKRQDHHYLEAQGRIEQPMRYERTLDRYVPISWDEAFALVGKTLRELDSPDEAVLYASGSTSNEAAFLYQLFGRSLGTNNFPSCLNLYHEASAVALDEQLGCNRATVRMDDFAQADAIFLWGHNPASSHPRMMAILREAALRGAKIVAFNPLRERGLERFASFKESKDLLPGGGVDIATHYLQVRAGGDMAAAKGILKVLLESHAGLLDAAFIRDHTDGYERLKQDAAATDWSEIEAQSGLTRAQLAVPAQIYAEAERTIFTWSTGLTQHRHSVATIQTLLDLLLIKGNIGKPGAGACPMVSQPNALGIHTMGITDHPAPAFLDRLESTFQIRAPRQAGYNTIGAVRAMLEGQAKVFIGLGGNFAAAMPDTIITEQALANCRLTVHIATKLNRSHLITGEKALILPALVRSECDVQQAVPQVVTTEDTLSKVRASSGVNKPISSHVRSEIAIIAGLAKAALPETPIDWDAFTADYGVIRDAISRVIPGFEAFNSRIVVPTGFHLRNPARERQWNTSVGKARFMANPLPPSGAFYGGPMPGTGQDPSQTPDFVPRTFTLVSISSHDQSGTSIYSYDDRYRGIFGYRRVVFMNPEDMETEGFAVGDIVDIRTAIDDGVQRTVQGYRIVACEIPRGQVASYFPEANVLLPLWSFAERTMTPTSKSIPVVLHKRSAD